MFSDDSALRERQEMALEAVLLIDEECKRNPVEYFLAYGSCLGAVRHEGFIPWDDDIDLIVRDEDYRTFRSVILRALNNSGFTFVDWEIDPSFPRLYGKVLKEGVPVVDVFRLVKTSDDYGEQVKLRKKAKWWTSAYSHKIIKGPSRKHDAKAFCRYWVRHIVGLPQLLTMSREEILAKNLDFEKAFEHSGTHTYMNTTGLYMGNRDLFDAAWLAKRAYLRFEGHELPVPAGYKEHLSRAYGDYMTPPKAAERTPRHFSDRFEVHGDK